MSISAGEWGLNGSLAQPFQSAEENNRPKRSSKRKINYYEGSQGEVEKVRRVSAEAISRGKTNAWSQEEVETVKRVVERFCSARGKSVDSWYFDSKIMDQTEMLGFGKTTKQVREKWINNLNPNSLGGSVLDCHKPIIKGLSDKYPKKWSVIVNEFFKMDFPGKPAGKYYSSNAIKNYIHGLNNKADRAKSRAKEERGDEGRSSSVTTAESSDKPLSFDEWISNKDQQEVFSEKDFSDDGVSIASLELENLKSSS